MAPADTMHPEGSNRLIMNGSFLIGLVVALVVILLTGSIAMAQTGVTAEQIRMFQNLPPSQQQQLLRMLQGSGSSFDMGLDMPSEVAVPEEEVEASQEIDFFYSNAESAASAGATRIRGSDTIVIETRLKEGADEVLARDLMADINRSRIIGSHVFELDKRGVLDLPGIASVPLAGLTAAEVGIRLRSEPLLSPLDLNVTILPLSPGGMLSLEPFGYELFGAIPANGEGDGAMRRRSTFDAKSLSYMPVPRDYVLGPGDSIRIQLWGNENDALTLAVQRDGTISFPKLGPRPVAGLTFGELKDEIEQWVAEKLIGTKASVSMGRLRSVRIFVVGDVKFPGGYTVSGLARMTNALFLAGGITRIGSLRQVELRRNGETVSTLDLYELLLRGDTRNDRQLRANDVVFVPPAKSMVGVDGEIRRPAIYELKSERNVGDLIELAGGLLPTGDATAVQLESVSGRGTRSVETLDLEERPDRLMAVKSGGLLTIMPVLEEVDDSVTLRGHSTRAGLYEWFPGMRLTDLVTTERMLKPKADLEYVLIRRESGADRLITLHSTDLGEALADTSSAANLELQVRDRVMVFELGVTRTAAIAAILRELRAQATLESPFQAVRISGEVRSPGDYPLEAGMRVSDLLRAGGGLNANAFATVAELRRYRIDEQGERRTDLIDVDVSAVLAGDEATDIELQPYDYLSIKEVPAWAKQFEVELIGFRARRWVD